MARCPPCTAWPLLATLLGGAALLWPAGCARAGAASCSGPECEEEGGAPNQSSPDGSGGPVELDGDALGGASNAPPEGDCIDVEVEFVSVTPTVVLLIDQSGTMNGDLGFDVLVQQDQNAGGYEPWGCPAEPGQPLDSPEQKNPGYRWNVVRSVLFGPDGIVTRLERDVRFGLALYTSRGGFGEAEPPKECPVLTEVAVDLENQGAMLAAMKCDDIIADTPTREALTLVSAKLAAVDDAGPKLVILATDGEPDTCACPFWGESAAEACRPSTVALRGDPPITLTPEQAEQYDVVQEARRIHEEQDIAVHVIDVSSPGSGSLRAHLAEVAEAGGGALFDGTRPTGLVSAFRRIIDGVRSCSFDLHGTITEGREKSGTVRLDGEEVSLVSGEDESGYIVRSKERIDLVGTVCETIREGGHALDIRFPCDSFKPVK